MPDRYADAVRARRAELRAQRALLDGGHRAALRSALALIRVTAATELAAALASLAREIRGHVDRGGRAERARLPPVVAAAVRGIGDEARERRTAAALPAIRRIAAERGIPPDAAWPSAPPPAAPVELPAPDPRCGIARALVAGAAGGAGAWRLALLPAVGLPVLGLPALGGPVLLPLVAGAGLAAVLAVGGARQTAVDRARWLRWSAEALATARAGLEAELGRWLVELERDAAEELDAAVARCRATVDAELRALAPDRRPGVSGVPA